MTQISQSEFGTLEDGRSVTEYILSNDNGMTVHILNYGAIVSKIFVPDKNGVMADVVLGYDTLAGYQENPAYLGATIGRFANRIAGGKFTLNGVDYTLALNNGPNALHGGPTGFHKQLWDAEVQPHGVRLSYTSPDGEEGFPGELAIQVSYQLKDNNTLVINYKANTNKPTICNFTNHSYFNLSGVGNGGILNHQLQIHANAITAVNESQIPTGVLSDVSGTPFDFTKPEAIGARIDSENEQIIFGSGYDHNFVLSKPMGHYEEVANVFDPDSGRTMQVFSSEPGIQLYTGNFLDGTIIGKAGKTYQKRSALCLELQHYPDTPNQPAFPSCLLEPSQTYSQVTAYQFGVKK